MDKSKVWRHWELYDKRILMDMPSEYELKSEIRRQYVFIGSDKKGIVVSEIPTTKDTKAFLWNMYVKVKSTFELVTEPSFFKRSWMGIEQRMMQFAVKDKKVIYVILDNEAQQYMIEFTYQGNDEVNWKKECEYILNNIHVEKGENKNGN